MIIMKNFNLDFNHFNYLILENFIRKTPFFKIYSLFKVQKSFLKILFNFFHVKEEEKKNA